MTPPRTTFPTRYSVLSPDALQTWLTETYDFPEAPECKLVSLSLNDVYLVTVRDLRAYLRIYRHGMRTEAEVAAELHLVQALAERGVSVAAAIPRRDGMLLSSIEAAEGTRYAALSHEAPGGDVRDITIDHARAYGKLAAQIHAAADDGAAGAGRRPIDVTTLIDEPLNAIRRAIPEDPNLAEFATIASEVRQRLTSLPQSQPDFGMCHGDLHPGNVRFATNGQPTLFDFDCCGDSWRGYDLAVFYWNSFGERRPRRWQSSRWRAFLRGYQEVRALPAHLDSHLADFLTARQVWLTGLDFAGQSGYPPQWIGPGLISTSLTLIRTWRNLAPVL